MSKSLARKIIVALICALVAPFSVALLFVLTNQPLTIAAQEVVSFSSLLALPSIIVWMTMVAGITFAVSFLSAQLVPSRRRRQRNSGTVVESDVEDGRERGVVKWFNVKKGFGFITWDQGEDVFVHFRSIRGDGHRSLSEGQRVKFTVVSGEKGPQAEDVSAVR